MLSNKSIHFSTVAASSYLQNQTIDESEIQLHTLSSLNYEFRGIRKQDWLQFIH